MMSLRRSPYNCSSIEWKRFQLPDIMSALLPAALTTPQDPEFLLFKNLAMELRLKIWVLALPGPRSITIQTRYPSTVEYFASEYTALEVTASDLPPALLFVNTESRAVALKHYFPLFTQVAGGSAATNVGYMDFNMDVIYVSPWNLSLATRIPGLEVDFDRVKNLALLGFIRIEERFLESISHNLKDLPNLESLFLDSLPDCANPLVSGPQQADFHNLSLGSIDGLEHWERLNFELCWIEFDTMAAMKGLSIRRPDIVARLSRECVLSLNKDSYLEVFEAVKAAVYSEEISEFEGLHSYMLL